MIIRLNICVSDIEKERIRTSDKNGKKYLSLTVMDTRNNDYGNDGIVSHDTTKEEREENPKARGKIIGNWKWVYGKPEGPTVAPGSPVRPPTPKAASDDQDEIPF